MNIRTNQISGEKVSLLGYGCMRMPCDADQKIDYGKACQLIDYAYAHGVNYYDTAYVYHGGQSEVFIGAALKKYPRESFFLATKMPGWEVKTGLDDAKRLFAEQLSRCQVEYFDYYLLHALGDQGSYDKIYKEYGVLEYLDAEKAAGRIRNLGFSFHGSLEFFEYMMKQRRWDFVQIQLNYLDWNEQNAKRLYELCEEYDVPVIIMEPVRGGSLVSLCDESIEILKAAEPAKSTASWAIRFAATPPNVLTVLSGMSAMDQVVDNVATLTDFAPLNNDDYGTLSDAITAYINKGTIACTGCRYCMDCPSGVDIPEVFSIYNQCASAGNLPISIKQNDPDIAKKQAAFKSAFTSLPASAQPSKCTACNKCVEHCPQSIKIPDMLKNISKYL